MGEQAPTGQQPPSDTRATAPTQIERNTDGLESRLEAKVAVVTGAARGIGRAIAVAFASSGADVVGIDIAGPATTVTRYPHATADDLAETGRQVAAKGRRWQAIVADIRDLAALRRADEQARRSMGTRGHRRRRRGHPGVHAVAGNG